MKNSRYFPDIEFNRCTPSCSIEDMDQQFLDILDGIREEFGQPMVMNSAYRSIAWDKAHGRSGNGAHTYGLAVDIRCPNRDYQERLKAIARKHDIVRIGTYDTFLHIDIGDTVGLPKTEWHG